MIETLRTRSSNVNFSLFHHLKHFIKRLCKKTTAQNFWWILKLGTWILPFFLTSANVEPVIELKVLAERQGFKMAQMVFKNQIPMIIFYPSAIMIGKNTKKLYTLKWQITPPFSEFVKLVVYLAFMWRWVCFWLKLLGLFRY